MEGKHYFFVLSSCKSSRQVRSRGRRLLKAANCPSEKKKGIVGESQEDPLRLAKLWTRVTQDKSISHWLSLRRSYSGS